MRINTNVMSLNAQESATNTNKRISSSLEKLSSGLALNKAADDASGMAIADKLRTQASSISQGISNANSASALIQIADKAMSEQSNILDIVKQKLIQASTDTTTDAGREAIRKDVTKLLDQFDAIASQTNYNGITLLQASATSTAKQDTLTFQLGEEKEFDVTMTATNASNTEHLGGGADTLDWNEAVTSTDGGGSKDNNLGVNDNIKINTSDDVILTTIDIANTGAETATSGIDITLSGNVGNIDVASTSFKLDFSNESQEVQDALTSLIDNNVAGFTTAEFDSFGKVSLGSGNTLDLSSYSVFDNLSQVRLTGGAGAAGTVTLNSNDGDVEFSVSNNASNFDTPLLSNINVQTSGTATGGKLLSSLKGLTEGQLTNEAANNFMKTIDEALTQINKTRSDFGSSQNQIESSLRNMQTTHTNLKAAESVIRDVDYAAESANFNKQNIIAQAGTYAMSQANAAQQNVMRLLQ
jgi:flagellin